MNKIKDILIPFIGICGLLFLMILQTGFFSGKRIKPGRQVKIGDTIPFYVGALNKNFKGVIKEIVPAVDPGSRTFIVRICIGAEPELFPGMYGVISLPLGNKKIILIPENYIDRVGQLKYVNVLTENNHIVKTFIRTADYPPDKSKSVIIPA